ncbi:hypothetical protein Tco_1195399 [Tanacetum coccineum]
MSVSHIPVSSCFNDESIGSSTPYIILTDSEVEDATLALAPAPLSLEYVPASPDYTPDSDSDSEPFEEDPQEANKDEYSEEEPSEDDSSDEDPMETDGPFQAQVTPIRPVILVQPGQEILIRHPYKTLLNGVCMMRIPEKTVHPPYILLPAIEAAIAKEIAAPPCKRYRSPSPSSAPSSPSLSPSPSPSRKRCRSPSPPPPLVPSPRPLPLSSSPPSALLLPHKRFQMTSPQTEATKETIKEAIEETFEETTTEAIAPTRLFHHIMPLLVARLIRHEDRVEEIHDHLMEIPLERIETLKQEVEMLRDKTKAAKQQIGILQESLGIARDNITESQIRMEDVEARLQ